MWWKRTLKTCWTCQQSSWTPWCQPVSLHMSYASKLDQSLCFFETWNKKDWATEETDSSAEGDRVLGCTFGCGSRKGRYVLIPRIDTYYKQDLPLTLKRRQFPDRLYFAVTINESQGQISERVGICLNDPIFSHGQLNVALSRERSKESKSNLGAA